MFVGGTNTAHVYVETSSPAVPFATAVRPRAAATIRAGTVEFVDGHAGVPAGTDPGSVTIALSTTGPDGPWTEIASGSAALRLRQPPPVPALTSVRKETARDLIPTSNS